jgi:hypothetical protein
VTSKLLVQRPIRAQASVRLADESYYGGHSIYLKRQESRARRLRISNYSTLSSTDRIRVVKAAQHEITGHEQIQRGAS